MSNTALISVIVCTYNRGEMLRTAIGDMTAQTTDDLFSYEIVVVDDASSDDTAQIIAQQAAGASVEIKYVKAAGRGYTAALNVGVSRAAGDWIAFFDDDQRAGRTWLLELFSEARKGKAEIVGGSIILQFENAEPQRLGPLCRRLFGEHPSFRDLEHPTDIPLPAGGNRIVHRRVFDVIGRFDESFNTGGCDRDLLLRAKVSGFSFAFAPKAAVWHRIPSDRAEASNVKRYSLQAGVAMAYIDWRHRGGARTTLLCIARVCQALLWAMPRLVLTRLSRVDWSTVLDLKIVAWTTEGYVRKVLLLMAPHWFSQKQFFSGAQFRKLRNLDVPQS